ncbi:MAG: DegV family protein [Butyricicoccus sp.]
MNRQKIALMTDSCADIPAELLKKYDIYMVPLIIRFPEGEYQDGVTIQATEIYRRQKEEMPQTSLPDGTLIEDAFRRIREAGYEKVLAVHLSGGLSGTCNMVQAVGRDFVGLEVRAFDSLSGSLGTGLTVLQLAKYIEEGRTWPELLRATPKLIANTKVFFCVDTLEFLQKGGRIGKITAVAGTLLQIKPIITFAPGGELVNVAKVRGRKLALDKMVQMVKEYYPGQGRYNIAVAHGDSPAELKQIRAAMQAALPAYESCCEGEIDCTLATYVGPHLLGAGIQLLPDDLFSA